jgi:hypothetical protein
MKTRSGIVLLPRSWPSVYEARKGMTDVQNRIQMIRAIHRIVIPNLDAVPVPQKRLIYLTASEMVFKYHFLLTDAEAQKLIDGVIEKSEDCPELNEYVQKFKLLSDQHRLKAQRTYIEFLLKGSLNVDVARHIASFI